MKPRTMKTFLAASGALLLGLVALPAKGAPDRPPEVRPAVVPAPVPAAAPPAVVATARARPALFEEQRARTASLRWGRDPFAGPIEVRPATPPPAPVVVELPALPRLSGLSVGASGPRAILDRDIAAPGDALSSGWTVQVIEAGFVTLRYESEIRILQLRDDP